MNPVKILIIFAAACLFVGIGGLVAMPIINYIKKLVKGERNMKT